MCCRREGTWRWNGEMGRFEDRAERLEAERTSSIQSYTPADPTMRMNMRARKTCVNQSQDRNSQRKMSERHSDGEPGGDKCSQGRRDLGLSATWDTPSVRMKTAISPEAIGMRLACLWIGPEGSSSLSHGIWKCILQRWHYNISVSSHLYLLLKKKIKVSIFTML